MSWQIRLVAFVAVLFSYASVASAAFYTDATGDVAVPGNPFPHIDITSVSVSNTATNLVFTINVNGNPVATDWGKYTIGIDSVAGGDTAGNGWGRPIGMSSGMDYWIASWVDGAMGRELYKWNGSLWSFQSFNTPSKTTSSVTLTASLSSLGLVPGNTILFDVYTTGGGGGDGAVDALGNPNPSITNWGDYYNSGSLVQSYTVVPEPTTILMWGVILGSVGLVVKRMKAI